MVTAEARRTFTALALYGYAVDLVVANRVFPAGDDPWRQAWAAAQAEQLAALRESFAGLPVLELPYLAAEPVGVDALQGVAEALYGPLPGTDPAAATGARRLLAVESDGDGFVLRMALPLAERGEVDAARVGDELVVTVAGHRRVLTLPSVLRRCTVAGGSFDGLELSVRFRADPSLRPPESRSETSARGSRQGESRSRRRPSPRPRPADHD